MSDQFGSLFNSLRGLPPPGPFAPAAAVRRRGRQRANRQAVSVGIAVLAVTGLGAGGLVTVIGQPDPPLPPAATSPLTESPSPTGSDGPTAPAPVAEIPDSWLLAAADLPGTGWDPTSNELLEGPWYWEGGEACPEYRIEDHPSVQRRLDVRTVSFARPGEAMPERVDQLVEVFEPGAGSTNLADVRAFVELCSRRPVEGDEFAPTYYEVEQTGFAGDESLLLRVEEYGFTNDDQIEPAGEFYRVAVVRVGDAVTTIRLVTVDEQGIAVRAAERLR